MKKRTTQDQFEIAIQHRSALHSSLIHKLEKEMKVIQESLEEIIEILKIIIKKI